MTLAEDLHQQLLAALRDARRAEHRLASLLLRMNNDTLFRDHGYKSLRDYAKHELDLEPGKTKALLALARGAPDLPELERCFADGTLGWTKARQVLRVATPDTVDEWVEYAGVVTSRQLERTVSAAKPGDSPPGPGELAAELPGPRVRKVLLLEVADAELLERASALLRSQTQLDGEDLDDGRLAGMLIRRVAHDLEQETEQPPTEPIYRTVISRCPDCAQAWSPDHLVMDHVEAYAADDGDVVDLTQERGTLKRHIPEKVRRAVLARDGYRCIFPGCECRLWLDLHHTVVPFSEGGPNEEWNLGTVCTLHHGAIHGGRCATYLGPDDQVWVVHRRGVNEPARIGVGEPSWRGSHVRPSPEGGGSVESPGLDTRRGASAIWAAELSPLLQQQGQLCAVGEVGELAPASVEDRPAGASIAAKVSAESSDR